MKPVYGTAPPWDCKGGRSRSDRGGVWLFFSEAERKKFAKQRRGSTKLNGDDRLRTFENINRLIQELRIIRLY